MPKGEATSISGERTLDHIHLILQLPLSHRGASKQNKISCIFAIFSCMKLCVCCRAEEQHVQTWSLRLSVYLSPGPAKVYASS